jgi:hypothetical protein
LPPWPIPPRQYSAHGAAGPLVDNDGEVPIPRFSSRSALALCGIADEVLLLRPMLSCLSSISHPCVHTQPAPQASGRCPLGYGYY